MRGFGGGGEPRLEEKRLSSRYGELFVCEFTAKRGDQEPNRSNSRGSFRAETTCVATLKS